MCQLARRGAYRLCGGPSLLTVPVLLVAVALAWAYWARTNAAEAHVHAKVARAAEEAAASKALAASLEARVKSAEARAEAAEAQLRMVAAAAADPSLSAAARSLLRNTSHQCGRVYFDILMDPVILRAPSMDECPDILAAIAASAGRRTPVPAAVAANRDLGR